MNTQPQNESGQHIRQQAEQFVVDHGPHCRHIFGGKQIVTDIHNRLSGGVQHQELGSPGELRVIGDHGNGVDDRCRIEHCLQHDFPDMRHVTKIDEQGSEQQCYTQAEAVQLQNTEGNQQHAPSVMGVGEETEQDNHQQIDTERNHGTHGGGSDDDVVREVNFTKQVAASDDGLHTHAGGLREEAPQAGATQQRNGECRSAVGELQELHEHHVHYGE